MSRHAHASLGSVRITLGAILAGLVAIAYSPAAHALILPPAVTSGTLLLHLDANAINGIGNPNPTDGASVSTWTDLSGNGNNATQVTAGLRPTYSANQTPNSSGAVQFNGSTQFLLDPASAVGPTTWFLVYNSKGGPTSTGSPITLRQGVSSNFDEIDFLNGLVGYQTITIVADGGSAATVGINPAFDSSSHLVAFGYDGVTPGATSSYKISYDQAASTVNASGGNFISFAQSEGTIGQRGDNGSYYSGNISAILVYSGELNTTDYNAVQSYLNSEFLIAPEPASLGLVMVGGVMLLRRRRA